MKVRAVKSYRSLEGNALVLALVIGTVVGAVLMSYLSLIQSRTLIRARSFAWNSAIPVLEAGIEEAFTHLRDDGPVLTANNWTKVVTNGVNIYQKRRDFSDGSYCFMTISNVPVYPFMAPIIYSRGYVPAPLGQGYISRLVRVDVTNSSPFSGGIAARGMVDLNGQAIVDSYDSSNTNYSTGGRYDPAKRKDNGRVVTDSNANPAIDAGNGHIYGMVDTGPTGTASTTSGGTIGDLTWSASNSGIEPGFVAHDVNVYYPDQNAPASTTTWPVPSTGLLGLGFTYPPLLGAHYDYEMNSESNKVSGTFSLNGAMLILGNCSLYITGDFKINGGGSIVIATNSSLSIYVGGIATITGGGIINTTGLAANLAYYGLTNNTSIKYAGTSDFVGTVNAPEADFILTGGANFYGAAIVNTYTSKSAGAGFHYDENLPYRGNLRLVGYREL